MNARREPLSPLAAAANVSSGPSSAPHSLLDDAQGILTGTLFAGLGIALFKLAGLMTGGTVGIAFLAYYATGWPFGPLLFCVNLPFYALAWARLGWRFTLKTIVAVGCLAAITELLPRWIVVQSVHPLFAALGGGLLVGAGLLFLFRHHASLGGLNVLVLWLEERFGWRAGVVQMLLDIVILLAGWPLMDGPRFAYSVLAAIALNFALAVNHRPGRYLAF